MRICTPEYHAAATLLKTTQALGTEIREASPVTCAVAPAPHIVNAIHNAANKGNHGRAPVLPKLVGSASSAAKIPSDSGSAT